MNYLKFLPRSLLGAIIGAQSGLRSFLEQIRRVSPSTTLRKAAILQKAALIEKSPIQDLAAIAFLRRHGIADSAALRSRFNLPRTKDRQL